MIESGVVPELQKPCYEFMKYWQYQSTDESVEEDTPGALDPHSDEEGHQPVVRVWRARAPAWRTSEVSNYWELLETCYSPHV